MLRRGFTLMELMVVVLIISILMGLLLPAVSRSRHQARLTVGTANLRSVSQMMLIYKNSSREEFLNPFRPQWPDDRFQFNDAVSGDQTMSWRLADDLCNWYHTDGFSGVWYSYLAEFRGDLSSRAPDEQYSPADADALAARRDAQARGGVQSDQLYAGTFRYSSTFWLKPSRFAGTLNAAIADEIRTATVADVVYPDRKVMIWERADFSRTKNTSPRHSVVTVDGSVRSVLLEDCVAPARSPLQPPCGPSEQYFQHTMFGVKGADLRLSSDPTP